MVQIRRLSNVFKFSSKEPAPGRKELSETHPPSPHHHQMFSTCPASLAQMFSTCPASSCLDQSHARSSSCHSWTPFLLWRIPPRLATGKRTLISHYQSRNTYFSAYFILSCNSQFPSAPPPPAACKHLCSETAGRFNLWVCRASDSTL